MTTPTPFDGEALPPADFVCIAFLLPTDTTPFETAFGEGGSRIKYIPIGWKFIMIERLDTMTHAMFQVCTDNLKGLDVCYIHMQSLIKRAYKR